MAPHRHDMDNNVAQVERILGYTFRSKTYCAEALQVYQPELLVTVVG